eukprot:XP_001702866.1 predicted protein [Chlamydomonas reinhardtii]
MIAAGPCLLLPEIVSRIYRFLDYADLECGLLVCRTWRQALTARVCTLWLTVDRTGASFPHTPIPPPSFSRVSALCLQAGGDGPPHLRPPALAAAAAAGLPKPLTSLADGLCAYLPNLTYLDLAPSWELTPAGLALAAGDGGDWNPAVPRPPDQQEQGSAEEEAGGTCGERLSLSNLLAAGSRGGAAHGRGGGGGGGPGGCSCGVSSGRVAGSSCAAVDLAAARGFAGLPQLRHISACLAIGDSDRMAAWAGVLAALPPALTSLKLLGPLCYCPDLAAAVAGWRERLPALRQLHLELGECCHSHPDLESEMYGDPDSWTSSCFAGVLPKLTQLRSLQLDVDDITADLWRDVLACYAAAVPAVAPVTAVATAAVAVHSGPGDGDIADRASSGDAITAGSCTEVGMHVLRLRQRGFSGACDGAGIANLHGLTDLCLTLGDGPNLSHLSCLTRLTRLELQLLGLADYVAAAADAAAAVAAEHLHLNCRSAAVGLEELGAIGRPGFCPRLRLLQLQAPLRAAFAAETAAAPPVVEGKLSSGPAPQQQRHRGSGICLPDQLEWLGLANTETTAGPGASWVRPVSSRGPQAGATQRPSAPPLLRLAGLPPGLRNLQLMGITLEVDEAHNDSSSMAGAEEEGQEGGRAAAGALPGPGASSAAAQAHTPQACTASVSLNMSTSAFLLTPRVSANGEPVPLLVAKTHPVSAEEDAHSDSCTESSVRSEPRLSLDLDAKALGVPGGIPRLPDYAIPLQPKLLKQINSMHSKEELLAFVGQCYIILDPINLVTCVYRLARMFTGIRHPESRQAWKTELSEAPSFQVLLRTIQSHMLAAQMHPPYSQEVKGIDARCVSNLIWALVKLDLALEVGCIGNEVILSISPLVLRLLGQSSPQGLANLLWAYAKLAEPPIEVIASIMTQMTDMLARDQTGNLFDAQALSNSIWAVAHARSKLANFDGVCGPPGAVSAFLVAIAISANTMLKALYTRLDLAHLSAFLNNVEHKFSCQALVNIVWSFATILGEECGQHPIIAQLFTNSRKEAIIRQVSPWTALQGLTWQRLPMLRATYAALQTQQSWVYHLPGGFNEQALSNVVYAYEKAGLLDRELLQWVFSVATLRLDRRDAPPSFKPQELCTLLRAAHLDICEPQPFLAKLARIVQTMPWIMLLQLNALVASMNNGSGGGMGGGGPQVVNASLAAELLAAELQQMTLQNALAQHSGSGRGSFEGSPSGMSSSSSFPPHRLSLGVSPSDPVVQPQQPHQQAQAAAAAFNTMQAMQYGAASRAMGMQMMPATPNGWS